MKGYIVSLLSIFLLLYSCSNGNQTNHAEIRIDQIEDSTRRLDFNVFLSTGISERKKYAYPQIIYLNQGDSILLESTTLLNGIKFLHPELQVKMDTKRSGDRCSALSLKYNRKIGHYFECVMGPEQKRFYLILSKVTDTSTFLVPIKPALTESNNVVFEPLNSFFYIDYRTGKIVNVSFYNFWVLKRENLALNNLSTISFLNTDLYETFMMYFFKFRLKFSVSTTYEEPCSRTDIIEIPDSLFIIERKFGEKNIYDLRNDFSMDNLIVQDRVSRGIPIIRYKKDMGRWKIPAWCLRNEIY